MANDPAEPPHTGGSGYKATFHLPDGSRLVAAVVGAVALSSGGDRGPTRLVVLGPDRRELARADLAALLIEAGVAPEPATDPTDRGIWPSEDAYVRAQIAEHLPPFLEWLLSCCDPARLRAGYTAGALRLWSTPAADGHVHVFESVP